MNKYESVIIINPNVDEEGIKALVQKFTDLINNDGKVEKVDELGKRRLAYEVQKNKEGYYIVFKFEAKPEVIAELERISGLTAQEAKDLIIKNLENEAKHDAQGLINKIEQEAQLTAEKKAKDILITTIQRIAPEITSDITVTTVSLPSDEMKGRIIGREGRNIRTLETLTGVDIIIDDTPEAVVISCFDPVRKEIAKESLERLISDGRIHPARIEEIVQKVTQN